MILPLTSDYRQQGFSYIEVLVAAMLISIALVPALDALNTGLISADIHKSLTTQHYLRLSKMEQLQTENFIDLLAAAKTAGNSSTASTYSDTSGTSNRRLVYLALYDADADPFTITDPNTDNDNDPYTGSTSNLLWLRVETEGNSQTLETLLSR